MSAAEEATLSKSARKRANKKARDAAAGEEEEAPPAPAPKATPKQAAAKPKAQAEPAPAPKAEAKAKAKGKAKAEAAPAPEPKAKAKAKAQAEVAAEPKAKPAAAKPEAKAKAKGKAKPKVEDEEQPKPQKEEKLIPTVIDDGSGGAWEVSTGVSKKQQKRLDRIAEEKAQEEMIARANKHGGGGSLKPGQHIPGMASPAEMLKAQSKAKAKAAPVTAVVTAAAAAAKDKEPEKAAAPADNNVTASVKIDQAKIGRVIGPKGSNIALIKEKTGIKTIDTAGDLCTIVGPADAVVLAEHAIRELMDKGYMSLSFEDFKEDGVMVHPSVFPLLIGEKGCIIQVIKKEAKCEIDIPAVPKNGPAGKKYKVGVAGSNACVEKGKEIINSIVKHGYHEITHPGFTHQELEVEEWKYRFLIGKGGSEMRHIQNNYKVKVNIPRETSSTDKVVVLGEARDVDRAVKYIEKVLYEAEQPRGRGAPEQAEDTYGDEGPEEEWMSAYMYKRR